MRLWLVAAAVVLFVVPVKAQLAVQGDNYLLSLNSGIFMRQTGLRLEQGNAGLELRGGFDYWLNSFFLLRNAFTWNGTLIPSAKTLADESLRPLQTGKLDSALYLLVLDRPQLQLDLGLGAAYTGFTYWNGSDDTSRPVGELAIRGLSALRWLVTSDFALDLSLAYGIAGGSLNRDPADLEVWRSKFWFVFPPRYVSAKLSVLLRNWPSLVVNGSLKRSWGGWSYEMELYQSAIVSPPVLKHNLMFEARLFSPFLRESS